MAGFLLWVAVVAGIVSAVAGFVSAIISAREQAASEKQTKTAITALDNARLRFDVEIRQAQAETAKANMTSAEANARSASLREAYERLQLETAKLTIDALGRHITPEMKTIFKDIMAGECFDVVINYENDNETRSYAHALRGLFDTGGCDIVLNGRTPSEEDSWTPITVTPPAQKYRRDDPNYTRGEDRFVDALLRSKLVQYDSEASDNTTYVIDLPSRGIRENGKVERPFD
jgi:hypothetical protein